MDRMSQLLKKDDAWQEIEKAFGVISRDSEIAIAEAAKRLAELESTGNGTID
jgi:hypothetical protein